MLRNLFRTASNLGMLTSSDIHRFIGSSAGRLAKCRYRGFRYLPFIERKQDSVRLFSTKPKIIPSEIEQFDAKGAKNVLDWYSKADAGKMNEDLLVLDKIVCTVEKHIRNNQYDLKSLLDIGSSFGDIGLFSRTLASKLFDKISLERLQLEDCLKLMQALTNFKVSHAASLNIALLNQLAYVADSSYDAYSASLVLKYLGQLGIQSKYRESIHYSSKLLKFLDSKLKDLSIREMNNILEFYSNTPIFSRDLLYKTYSKVGNLLETSQIPQQELLRMVKTTGRMVFNGTVCPSEYREKLREHICKQDYDIDIKEYSELVLGLNQFTAFLADDLAESLKLKFQGEPFSGHSFGILKGLTKMNAKSLDIVLPIKDEILSNLLSSDASNLILAYFHLSNSKPNKILDELILPIKQKLLSDLTSSNMLDYISSLRSLIRESSQFNYEAFQELFKKLLQLLHDDTSLSDATVFNLSIPFSRSDSSLSHKIFFSRSRNLDSSVISTILKKNENTITPYELTKIFKAISKPSEDMILFSFSYLDYNVPQHLLYELLSYSNHLPGSIIKTFDFQAVSDTFFNKVKEIGSRNIETFKSRMVEYLDSLPADQYSKHYFLHAFSCIAKLHKQSVPIELSAKVLDVYLKNESLYKNPFVMDLFAIYKGFEGKEIIRENVFPKYFDISPGISLSRLQKIFKSYRYWPHNEGKAEEQFKQRILDRIERVNMNDIENIIDFLKNFEPLKYQSHQDLVSSSLRALTSKIIQYQSALPLESVISVMKSVTKHETKLADYYQKTMNFIIEHFDKFNETQKVKVAHALAMRGLCDIEFFTELSQSVVNNTKRYYNLAHLVLSSFAELNLENTPIAQNALNAFLESFHTRRHHFDSELSWNYYIWSLVKLGAPLDEISRAVSLSNNVPSLNTPDFKKVLLLNHFLLHPLDVTYRNPNDVHALVNTMSFKRHFNHDSIANMKLRNLMVKYNIRFERGYTIDGIYTPFYLPSSECAVWLFHDNELLYSGDVLKGDFLMHSSHISEKYKRTLFLKVSEFTQIEDIKIAQRLRGE
jgi:hypothetical protein